VVDLTREPQTFNDPSSPPNTCLPTISKTAKLLGIGIPASFLDSADEVIEQAQFTSGILPRAEQRGRRRYVGCLRVTGGSMMVSESRLVTPSRPV
jgi:hypothetical protein